MIHLISNQHQYSEAVVLINRTNINWFVFDLIQSESTKSTKLIDQSSLRWLTKWAFLAASLQLILSQHSAVVATDVHVDKWCNRHCLHLVHVPHQRHMNTYWSEYNNSLIWASVLIVTGNVPSPNAPLKRVLAYTGCFSRMATIKDIHMYLSQRLRIKEEDMRLWLYNSEVGYVFKLHYFRWRNSPTI